MPRIRTIKPEFCESESMARLSREARLTYILLWTRADDEGRLLGNPILLANTIYPYDNCEKQDMERWLLEIEAEGCIERYVVEGKSYIQVRKWADHQKIEKPTRSKLPPPPDDDEPGGAVAAEPDSPKPPRNVGESSPIPPRKVGEASPPRARIMTGTGTGKGKERKGSGKEGERGRETAAPVAAGVTPCPEGSQMRSDPGTGPPSAGALALAAQVAGADPPNLQVQTGGLTSIADIRAARTAKQRAVEADLAECSERGITLRQLEAERAAGAGT